MKQIYFIITLLTTLTIGILSINSTGITFAQEQNETSSLEIEDSPLITTPELEESITTNNKSSYLDNNNTSMIEEILPWQIWNYLKNWEITNSNNRKSNTIKLIQ